MAQDLDPALAQVLAPTHHTLLITLVATGETIQEPETITMAKGTLISLMVTPLVVEVGEEREEALR